MESKYDGRRPEPPYVTDAERELEDCREAQKMLMDTYEEVFDERDQLRARNAELEKRIKWLEERDGKAHIELCFDDGFNPFARESLRIVDIGVADNCYVVESNIVGSLRHSISELEAKLKTCCTIEAMLANPNVNSLIKQHEKTIEALEAKLAALVEAAQRAIPSMLAMNERSEGYTLQERFMLMKNLLDNVDNLKAAIAAAKESE